MNSLETGFQPPRPAFADVHHALGRLLPDLKGVGYPQKRGGAMGIGRGQTLLVAYDPDTVTGWLGGFFGKG